MKAKDTGFTLIEIMVVLAIVTAVVGIALPYMNNRNADTKKFLRQMTILSREIHQRAKVNGAVYRLVFDLKEIPVGDKMPQQYYWVERADKGAVLKENEEAFALEQATAREDRRAPDNRGFQIDTNLTKEPRPIPFPMHITRIELTRLQNPITSGKAFIHYLPEGLVDEAAILVKGIKEQSWTIAIHPLTGKAEVVSKDLSLRDLKSQ